MNDSAHTQGATIRELIQHPKKNTSWFVSPILPIFKHSTEERHLADATKQGTLVAEEGTRDPFLLLGIAFERIQLVQLFNGFRKFVFFFFEFLAQSSIIMLGIGIVEPCVTSFEGNDGVSGLVSAFNVRLELLYHKIEASLHFVNGADLVAFEIFSSSVAAPPARAARVKKNGSSEHNMASGRGWGAKMQT